MRKKTIAILLLLAVMFCAFAETKTLNVNLSIAPIFEVKWTGTQLTEDNAKTTSLDSLSAPDPIVLNSDNNYTSESTIYASWRTNYAQPLTVKITPENIVIDSSNSVSVQYSFTYTYNDGNDEKSKSGTSGTEIVQNFVALESGDATMGFLRYGSIPVTGITVSEDALKTITVPAGSKLGTAVEFKGTMTIEVTVG